jgi:Protein of unknown function (DUF805)
VITVFESRRTVRRLRHTNTLALTAGPDRNAQASTARHSPAALRRLPWNSAGAIVSAGAGALDAILGIRSGPYGGTGPIQGILQLALLVPTLAVGARRLHDTGRSGWWQLSGLIPIVGWIILIVLFVQDSQPANQYGPNPKGLGEGYGAGYTETPPPSPRQY